MGNVTAIDDLRFKIQDSVFCAIVQFWVDFLSFFSRSRNSIFIIQNSELTGRTAVFFKRPAFFIFHFSFLISLLQITSSQACTCPPTELSLKECGKYEIIFRGKVKEVKDCEGRPGEAMFEVLELYKGNATKDFKVLFECKDVCAKKFQVGEEWIIYSLYKQINNAKMDWCSRSRKYFRNNNEDFYLMNYGNDYDEELKFLRDNLGLHRLLKDSVNTGERNKKPDSTELIWVLMASIAGIVVFYFVFNRLFK